MGAGYMATGDFAGSGRVAQAENDIRKWLERYGFYIE